MPYYYHPESGQTTWERPGALPSEAAAAEAEGAAKKKKRRRAKTSREGRGTARRERNPAQFWNKEYKPAPIATEPIRVVDGPGWTDPDGIRRRTRKAVGRRDLDPATDINQFSGGTRSGHAKETGPPLISQAFKEGLRESPYAPPLSTEEAEVEQLRQMLARAAGQRLPLFEY